MTKCIDVAQVPAVTGTPYSAPFDVPCRAREKRRLDDAAGFQAGEPNGHCLRNLSQADVLVLEVGSRVPGDVGHYSEIDMVAHADGQPALYTRRDGTPCADVGRPGPEDD